MKKTVYLFLLIVLSFSFITTGVKANESVIVTVEDEVFDFSLSSKNDLVVLSWDNIPENTNTVIIERSFDGKRYSKIYETNNFKVFTFKDDLFSIPVDEVYYRFHFILSNDSHVYSNSKLLSLASQDHLKPNIFVSGGQVIFDYYSSVNGNITAQVFNSTANLMSEERFRVEKGENSHEFSLYGLRSGMYFLRLELNGKTTTTKFFVR